MTAASGASLAVDAFCGAGWAASAMAAIAPARVTDISVTSFHGRLAAGAAGSRAASGPAATPISSSRFSCAASNRASSRLDPTPVLRRASRSRSLTAPTLRPVRVAMLLAVCPCASRLSAVRSASLSLPESKVSGPRPVRHARLVIPQRLEHRVDDMLGVEPCFSVLDFGLVLILERVGQPHRAQL